VSVDVVSVGARGPLGLSSLQLALCLRAAKLEPRSLTMVDKRGHEIGACVTGGLSATLYGYGRMIGLAAPALREAVRGAELFGQRAPAAPLPLVMSLPEAGRPDDDPRFASQWAADLSNRSGVPLDAERATLIREGHSGGAFALQAARELLEAGATEVVVGGVDSYYHPEVLAWLDDTYRLHALEAEDGLIPSEGAAFALLRRTASKDDGGEAMARLVTVGTGREASVEDEEAPNVAETTTALMSDLWDATGGVGWVLNDVNGERHRVREWSMVALRLLSDEVHQDRFAVQLGDVGAAVGPTLMAVACQLWRRQAAPAESVAVALHSEGTGRGVFAMRAP